MKLDDSPGFRCFPCNQWLNERYGLSKRLTDCSVAPDDLLNTRPTFAEQPTFDGASGQTASMRFSQLVQSCLCGDVAMPLVLFSKRVDYVDHNNRQAATLFWIGRKRDCVYHIEARDSGQAFKVGGGGG